MAVLRHGFLIACLAFSSCQMLFQPPLKVVDSAPAPGRYASVSSISVWVEFSTPVPRGRAEKGIILKENGSTMEVRYDWSAKRVALTPVAGFSMGKRYDLTVSSTVENADGVDMGTDYVLTFYTRPDDDRPTADIVSPAFGQTVTDRFQPVTFQFSQAVDRASFYANLSFTPSFKAAYTWGTGDTSCVVTPLEPLKTPSVYTVRLGSGLTDTDGNTLGSDVTSWFSEGTAGAGPTVSAVVKTVSGTPDAGYSLTPASSSGSVSADAGFERTWGLEIRFDRPVNRSGLDSFVSVEPAWGFTMPFTQATVQNVALVPAGPLVYGTTYTLTVRKGVTAADGNVSTADRVYRFKVDGAGSAPPSVETIAFHTNLPNPDTNIIQGDHSTDFTTIDASAFSTGSPTYLILTFKLAEGSVIDAASLMEHFSVSATDPNTSMALTAVGTPVTVDITHQSVRVDVLFTRGGSGLLVFKLGAGFADSLGNITGTDAAWPVRE